MAAVQTSDASPSIAAATAIGSVQLTVPSLERSRAFYEQVLGLAAVEGPDGSVLLGGALRFAPLLSLYGSSSATPRDPRQTGLFHLAMLLPTRRDLAVALVRLAQAGWRLQGASDHLVSEALYLSDPDGNGIEIYRDRERSEWRRDPEGRPVMATLPLDLDDLVGELSDAPVDPVADAVVPEGTRIGHVHLQVAELSEIERFYAGVLGFDVVSRDYPGALFVSAGGYHHHIGLNTWNSRGGSVPPAGSVGLRAYELRLGSADALDAVLARVAAAGIEAVAVGAEGVGGTEAGGAEAGGVEAGGVTAGATLVRDPSGNDVLLRV